eukprot:m.270456 g.270456  ORF g.270456 m.270456 type:complete len:383 (+) comp11083_c1_seq2:969-2117(+)
MRTKTQRKPGTARKTGPCKLFARSQLGTSSSATKVGTHEQGPHRTQGALAAQINETESRQKSRKNFSQESCCCCEERFATSQISVQSLTHHRAVQAGAHSDETAFWAPRELAALREAMAQLSKSLPANDLWKQVSLRVITKNPAECCRAYMSLAARKRNAARKQAKDGTDSADTHSKKPSITSKRGTIAHQREVFQFLAHQNDGHQDDYFGSHQATFTLQSTPGGAQKRNVHDPLVASSDDGEHRDSNADDGNGDGDDDEWHFAPPKRQHLQSPAHAIKSPNSSFDSPGLLKQFDRNALAGYLVHQHKRRYRRHAQDTTTRTNDPRHQGGVSKLHLMGHREQEKARELLTQQESPRSAYDDDEDEDQDFYFGDDDEDVSVHS